MTQTDNMVYVRNELNDYALLEGLAEECAELAQAALKLIRATDGENPTPVTKDNAIDKLEEEAGDVLAYMWLLRIGGVRYDLVNNNPKWARWAGRIREARKHDNRDRMPGVRKAQGD